MPTLSRLKNEKIGKPLTLTHETERWKKTVLEDYDKKELFVKIFDQGKLVYECPPLSESSLYRKEELEKFWDEYQASYKSAYLQSGSFGRTV